MALLNEATWQAVRPIFASAWPREAVVAVYDDGSWLQLDNVAADPLGAFELTQSDAAKLDAKRPLVLLHSHPNGSAEPSDRDTETQIASGYTWGVVAVSGNELGVHHVAEPEFFGPLRPRPPLLNRSYLWGVRDCWTLCEDYYHEQGIPFAIIPRVRQPGPAHPHPRGRDPFRYWPPRLGFKPVPREQRKPGDLALMFFRSPVLNHCAIYLGEATYLHQLENRTSEHWCHDNEEQFLERFAVQFWRKK